MKSQVMTLLICLSCAHLSACRAKGDEAPRSAQREAPSQERAKPELSVVSAARSDLLFLYQDKEGVEQRAMSVAEVPEERRAQVQVVDLARSPQERAASAYLQIFDLRSADEAGRFKGRLVPREAREQALASEQALPDQPPIVLYTTSWCGVCKKARRFMKSQGWAFIEKDIEADKEAKRELEQKARRAQMQLGGVPVIDVGGRLMSGFDQAALTKWVMGS